MADCIERQVALDLVESAGAWGWSKNQLYEEIQAVPAAVREDVQGEWKTDSDRPDTLICSACGAGYDVWKHDPHNFCPNCGARMTGGGER